MTASTFIGHFLGPDTHANRPAASGLPNGTLYVCTTHGKIERVVSGAWADYATITASLANVLAAGADANQIAITNAPLAINAQTASYTLVLADAGKLVSLANASANTLTVPANATAAFVAGSVVLLRQGGAGQTTVAAAGGVTVSSRGGALKLAGQYAYATLIKTATDSWELSGDIST